MAVRFYIGAQYQPNHFVPNSADALNLKRALDQLPLTRFPVSRFSCFKYRKGAGLQHQFISGDTGYDYQPSHTL